MKWFFARLFYFFGVLFIATLLAGYGFYYYLFEREYPYITEINGKKMRIRATKVTPVVTSKQQPLINFSEEEKFTLREVIAYLQTADVEGTIRGIQ